MKTSTLLLTWLAIVGLCLCSHEARCDDPAPGKTARTLTFDRADALKDWAVTGAVTIDTARGAPALPVRSESVRGARRC